MLTIVLVVLFCFDALAVAVEEAVTVEVLEVDPVVVSEGTVVVSSAAAAVDKDGIFTVVDSGIADVALFPEGSVSGFPSRIVVLAVDEVMLTEAAVGGVEVVGRCLRSTGSSVIGFHPSSTS